MSTTTEVKHTPGPWGICVNSNGDIDIAADDGEGDMVCDLKGCRNAEANAPLLRSAPDLLAALQSLVSMNNCNYDRGVDEYQHAMDAARVAIAKATGRS